jgi:hypothetical protein
VAFIDYLDSAGKQHRISGSNAETAFIGGSICAERAVSDANYVNHVTSRIT